MKERGARLKDKEKDGRRDEPLAETDCQVYGLHEQQEGGKRQGRHAGNCGLQRNREGAELHAEHGTEQRGAHNALFADAALHDKLPKFAAEETAVKGHVPDVRAERQQTAVRKEQALNREHGAHGEKSSLGAHNCGEQHAARKVAGGTCAGYREINHLRGKDKSAHHPHHGNAGLIVRAL